MRNKELHFEIPETIQHLYIETNNLEMLKKIRKFKHLRSLFLKIDMDEKKIFDALTEIFKSLRRIHLLYIFHNDLNEIPEAIDNLIHLQYLSLEQEDFTQLPRSLSNLYHLQFIICNPWGWCGLSLSSDFLPRDMNNLSNLHYLNLPWDRIPGMYGIGKLNSLQKLDGFYVKNEAGYTIKELECMNELRQLRIKHLENVEDAEQARNAKLCDKRNLTDLSLEWYRDGRTSRNFTNNDLSLDERVLDNLQPHSSLKKLKIHSYFGIRPAVWMNNANLITNLECIQIDNCLKLQTLPPFGQLPFLKSLYLLNMPKVKRLDHKFHGNDKNCVFPSLRLEALEDWFDAEATDVCLFPSLTNLCLENCPNSKELPYLPPKLKSLIIGNVGWKTLNCCSISKSISVEALVVYDCPNLSYIPLAVEIANLVALRKVTIIDCPSLISLGRHQKVETSEKCQLILENLNISDPSVLLMEALGSITSLQHLGIYNNDELVSFSYEVEQWFQQVSASLCALRFIGLNSLQCLPSSLESLTSLKILTLSEIPELLHLPKLPASLEQLELHGLASLQYLPPSLSSLSALKRLDLSDIPLLKSLPDLPPSLELLHIYGCHKELKERYDSTSGVDRDKLARIPYVHIS